MSALRVHAGRDGLEMRGVHTPAVATEMIDHKPVGYRAVRELVRKPVRVQHLPAASASLNAAVPVLGEKARPLPALVRFRDVHLRPKPFFQRPGGLVPLQARLAWILAARHLLSISVGRSRATLSQPAAPGCGPFSPACSVAAPDQVGAPPLLRERRIHRIPGSADRPPGRVGDLEVAARYGVRGRVRRAALGTLDARGLVLPERGRDRPRVLGVAGERE